MVRDILLLMVGNPFLACDFAVFFFPVRIVGRVGSILLEAPFLSTSHILWITPVSHKMFSS